MGLLLNTGRHGFLSGFEDRELKSCFNMELPQHHPMEPVWANI